jgi:hypothetical protein
MTASDVRGSCMGFAVSSDLEFQTLRVGGGDPLIVEDWSGPDPEGEELIRWRARPGNPFHGRLIRTDPGYAFWASDAGWYVIDQSIPKIAVEGGELSLISELRLFGVPSSLCATAAGDIALHASGVEIDGMGVLFAGPSLHGKTTLAGMFAAHGHRLLTEDTARVTTSPIPGLYPGPSIVRLREDVAPAIDIPNVERRQMPNGRVGLLTHADARGDGGAIPLRAIILLRTGDEVSVSSVGPAAAARDLFALSFLLPLPEHRASNFTALVDIVSQVEVLDLQRPLTLASTERVIQVVEDHVRS